MTNFDPYKLDLNYGCIGYPVSARYPATFQYSVPIPDSKETENFLLTYCFAD